MNPYYSSKSGVIYCGDCLEVLPSLGVKADAIICDPPYGTTRNKWDVIIPLDEMWKAINASRVEKGTVALFGSEPFSSLLRCSNLKNFKYDWIWRKHKASGYLNAKKRPLVKHEIISIFYGGVYYPQGLQKREVPFVNKGDRGRKSKKSSGECYGVATRDSVSLFTGYPVSVLDFRVDMKPVHPTQKPVDLLEYLIRTYSEEGQLVLDFAFGSGSTGVASIQAGRKFIGIEKEEKYCELAAKRIEDTENKAV